MCCESWGVGGGLLFCLCHFFYILIFHISILWLSRIEGGVFYKLEIVVIIYHVNLKGVIQGLSNPLCFMGNCTSVFQEGHIHFSGTK